MKSLYLPCFISKLLHYIVVHYEQAVLGKQRKLCDVTLFKNGALRMTPFRRHTGDAQKSLMGRRIINGGYIRIRSSTLTVAVRPH